MAQQVNRAADRGRTRRPRRPHQNGHDTHRRSRRLSGWPGLGYGDREDGSTSRRTPRLTRTTPTVIDTPITHQAPATRLAGTVLAALGAAARRAGGAPAARRVDWRNREWDVSPPVPRRPRNHRGRPVGGARPASSAATVSRTSLRNRLGGMRLPAEHGEALDPPHTRYHLLRFSSIATD